MKALTILNTTITTDHFGRYCLNDLHKAAGNEQRHKPSEWLRTHQAKEVVEELSGNSRLAPAESIKGGKSPGTYGIKEIVYSYAMWISPKFHIAVIRAYDAMVNASRPGLSIDTLSCSEIPRRFLVNQDRRGTSISEIPLNACCLTEREFVEYLQQCEGYIVMKKSELIQRIQAI